MVSAQIKKGGWKDVQGGEGKSCMLFLMANKFTLPCVECAVCPVDDGVMRVGNRGRDGVSK